MAKFLPLALAAAVLPGLAMAQSTEEVVTLTSEGMPFIGTLELPAGDPAPVVLLLHGFTGSRDELGIPGTDEGVFSRTARLLAEAGYASLRIDFRGSGESTANFTYESTTFAGQLADALAAVDYLSKSDKVKNDDIYVIGWSQGGLIASGVAGSGAPVDAVALWAAVADPVATYGALLGADSFAAGTAAAPDESITAALPWGADVTLNGAFFDGIETYKPLAEIAKYSGPLFVSKGTIDPTVLPQYSDEFIAAHEGPEELWTAEMDHAFNIFTSPDTLDDLAAATIAFFNEYND